MGVYFISFILAPETGAGARLQMGRGKRKVSVSRRSSSRSSRRPEPMLGKHWHCKKHNAGSVLSSQWKGIRTTLGVYPSKTLAGFQLEYEDNSSHKTLNNEAWCCCTWLPCLAPPRGRLLQRLGSQHKNVPRVASTSFLREFGDKVREVR